MFGARKNRGVKILSEGNIWQDSTGKLAARCLQLLLIGAVFATLIWALTQISTVVIPVLLAVILAATFAPVMRFLRGRGIPDLLATVLVLLTIFLVFAALVWMLTAAVMRQWDELAEKTASGFAEVTAFINSLPFNLSAAQFTQLEAPVTDFLTSSKFGTGVFAGLGVVGNFVTGLVLLLVVLFFFLKDGARIWEFLCRPLQQEAYARAQRIGAKTTEVFGSYVRGTATVAAVDAIGIGIGLAVLQVPLALPLAVLVFVLSFIPIVGAVLAGAIAALVALVSNGLLSAIIVVVIVIAVNQLEGNFLQPVLMGRALKLHSLVILLALTIGTVLGNILGAILAVPLVAAAWGAVQVWDGENQPARWALPKKP